MSKYLKNREIYLRTLEEERIKKEQKIEHKRQQVIEEQEREKNEIRNKEVMMYTTKGKSQINENIISVSSNQLVSDPHSFYITLKYDDGETYSTLGIKTDVDNYKTYELSKRTKLNNEKIQHTLNQIDEGVFQIRDCGFMSSHLKDRPIDYVQIGNMCYSTYPCQHDVKIVYESSTNLYIRLSAIDIMKYLKNKLSEPYLKHFEPQMK